MHALIKVLQKCNTTFQKVKYFTEFRVLRKADSTECARQFMGFGTQKKTYTNQSNQQQYHKVLTNLAKLCKNKILLCYRKIKLS